MTTGGETRPGEDLVVIGKVIRPSGLAGVVVVRPLTGDPRRFDSLKRVYLKSAAGVIRAVKPDRIVRGEKTVRMHFEEMGRLDDVEAFVGGDVCVPTSERWSLPEGSYYHSDLIDMEVVSERGCFLGRIADILEAPANDVFVVRDGEREILIPAIRSVVVSVDMEAGRMMIRPVEGLFEDHAV